MLLLKAGPAVCLESLLLPGAELPLPVVLPHWGPASCSRPPLRFLHAEGFLSRLPVPAPHQPHRKFKLTLLSGHLHLPTSKCCPPFLPVVGRIVPFPAPNVYLWIPRTCDYVILHGKREFADVISWLWDVELSRWAQSNHKRPYKSEAGGLVDSIVVAALVLWGRPLHGW